MIDVHKTVHVARKQFRVIVRGGLYWGGLVFASVLIFVVQLFFQGDIFENRFSGWSTMPSFIPYENQYCYTIIQAFFNIFLIGAFLEKKKKCDTIAPVYVRPESNVELLGGYFVAFLSSGVLGGCLVGLLGMLVHVFFSMAPFAFMPYVFYFFTLTLPGILFYNGLAFVFFTRVKGYFFSLMILLGCFLLNLCYADGIASGVFDPLGVFLPNVFSNMTGHPDLVFYLLQRGCWACIGLGCMGMAILGFERLPNGGSGRILLPVISILAGVICGLFFYGKYREDMMAREGYREIYNRYAKREFLTLERLNIDLHHEGKRVSCESELTLQNTTGSEIQEVFLFLNPSLKVVAVKEGEREIPVKRDGQVVRLERRVAPAERLKLVMIYEGGIDERVCYLDVADEEYGKQGENEFLTCRFGKHNVFLEKNFTLLLPECLWYPVSMPPVNPASPYEVENLFAYYTLRVSGVGKQKVFSQGIGKKEGEAYFFKAKYPLQGISLCMGDFLTWNVVVDSVCYEVCVSRENVDILRGLSHVTPQRFIKELRKQAEEQMRRPLPYACFRLIEVPLSFSSYYRGLRGGYEYAQPEMLFVPERGVRYWKNVRWEKIDRFRKARELTEEGERLGVMFTSGGKGFDSMSLEERENEIVYEFLRSFLFDKYRAPGGYWGDRGFDFGYLWRMDFGMLNPYSLAPLFFERLVTVVGEGEKVMNVVLHNIRKQEGERIALRSRVYLRDEEEAIAYLKGHSLEEAMKDNSLLPAMREKILSLKTDELFRLFTYRGIQPPVLFSYVDSCFSGKAFQCVDLGEMKRNFSTRQEVEWDSITAGWYRRNGLPTYLLKNFSVTQVDPRQSGMNENEFLHGENSQVKHQYRVDLEVYNDSDVDGLVVLSDVRHEGFGDYRYYSGNCRQEVFELKAKEGKVITCVYEDFDPKLDLGLAGNLPRVYFGNKKTERVSEYVENSVQYEVKEYFMGEREQNRKVVDNEDAAFQVHERHSWSLQDIFRGRDEIHEGAFEYPEEGKWKKAVLTKDIGGKRLFGTPIASAMYKLAGKGDLAASWKTEINEEGEYDVFVYVEHLPVQGNYKQVERSREAKKSLANRQYYTLRNGEEEYHAATDTRDFFGQLMGADNWFSLGTFTLKPGTVEVILWDKGEEVDQVIVADAVKFVFIEK